MELIPDLGVGGGAEPVAGVAVDEVRHGFEIVVREVAVVLGRVLAGAGGVHLRTDRLDLGGLAAGRRGSQQRRAPVRTIIAEPLLEECNPDASNDRDLRRRRKRVLGEGVAKQRAGVPEPALSRVAEEGVVSPVHELALLVAV